MDTLCEGSSNSHVGNSQFGVVISLETLQPKHSREQKSWSHSGLWCVYDWLIQSMSVSALPSYGSYPTAKVPDGWSCKNNLPVTSAESPFTQNCSYFTPNGLFYGYEVRVLWRWCPTRNIFQPLNLTSHPAKLKVCSSSRTFLSYSLNVRL